MPRQKRGGMETAWPATNGKLAPVNDVERAAVDPKTCLSQLAANVAALGKRLHAQDNVQNPGEIFIESPGFVFVDSSMSAAIGVHIIERGSTIDIVSQLSSPDNAAPAWSEVCTRQTALAESAIIAQRRNGDGDRGLSGASTHRQFRNHICRASCRFS